MRPRLRLRLWDLLAAIGIAGSALALVRAATRPIDAGEARRIAMARLGLDPTGRRPGPPVVRYVDVRPPRPGEPHWRVAIGLEARRTGGTIRADVAIWPDGTVASTDFGR